MTSMADETRSDEMQPEDMVTLHPNEAVPASASQACLAVSVLNTVPYVITSLVLYLLYSHFTANEMFVFMQSRGGQLLATCCFALVVASVMWSLFTLLSFWLHRLQILFSLRRRGLMFLLLLPTFLLGPFYGFSLLAVGAFKSHRRRLFLWCLPGILLGYCCLYGVLNMLSGELAVTWANAFLIPAVTLGLALASLWCIHLVSEAKVFQGKVMGWILGLHVVWLLVTVMFWVLAARSGSSFAASMARLEDASGMSLTQEGLVSAYYHDEQSATPGDHALGSAVEAGPRRLRDGRLPAVLDHEVVGLLDQTRHSPQLVERLSSWYDQNKDYFPLMDEGATGSLFKVDLSKTGHQYVNRQAIVSNLNAWMCTYHGRLRVLALNPDGSFVPQALGLLKHMTWLRDSALDDPFLLANGNCVMLESRRLNAIQTLLSTHRLNDGQLSTLSDELLRDSRAWGERTERASWYALAWYMSHVQNYGGGNRVIGKGGQSPLSDLLLGFVLPVQFWMLREDGRWALSYYLDRLGQPAMSLMGLEEEQDLAFEIPATATTSVSLMIPVRQQFIPIVAKQLALVQSIGIERYRLRHGSLPSSPEVLVPEYLPSLPLDPYSGHPFRYGLRTYGFTEEGGPASGDDSTYRQSGYQVYSVGWNRQDDGGVVYEEEKDETGKVISVRQDIVVSVWSALELPEGSSR